MSSTYEYLMSLINGPGTQAGNLPASSNSTYTYLKSLIRPDADDIWKPKAPPVPQTAPVKMTPIQEANLQAATLGLPFTFTDKSLELWDNVPEITPYTPPVEQNDPAQDIQQERLEQLDDRGSTKPLISQSFRAPDQASVGQDVNYQKLADETQAEVTKLQKIADGLSYGGAGGLISRPMDDFEKKLRADLKTQQDLLQVYREKAANQTPQKYLTLVNDRGEIINSHVPSPFSQDQIALMQNKGPLPVRPSTDLFNQSLADDSNASDLQMYQKIKEMWPNLLKLADPQTTLSGADKNTAAQAAQIIREYILAKETEAKKLGLPTDSIFTFFPEAQDFANVAYLLEQKSSRLGAFAGGAASVVPGESQREDRNQKIGYIKSSENTSDSTLQTYYKQLTSSNENLSQKNNPGWYTAGTVLTNAALMLAGDEVLAGVPLLAKGAALMGIPTAVQSSFNQDWSNPQKALENVIRDTGVAVVSSFAGAGVSNIITSAVGKALSQTVIKPTVARAINGIIGGASFTAGMEGVNILSDIAQGRSINWTDKAINAVLPLLFGSLQFAKNENEPTSSAYKDIEKIQQRAQSGDLTAITDAVEYLNKNTRNFQKAADQLGSQPEREIKPLSPKEQAKPSDIYRSVESQKSTQSTAGMRNYANAESELVKTPVESQANTESYTEPSTQEVAIDNKSLNTAQERLNNYNDMAAYVDSPSSVKTVLKAQIAEPFSTPKTVEIASEASPNEPYVVSIPAEPIQKFIDAAADITPAKLTILEKLPDVVKNGSYAGSGEYRLKTIEGKSVTVPYESFETPVTAGGERYLVKFDVADAPTGASDVGRAVRTIEIEKVSGGGGDTGSRVGELNALYDQNAPREANETPYQSLESIREDGYNNYCKNNIDISKLNFNKYLRNNIGYPPLDMVDPHAHHILFKEGNGSAQKALVEEGQALLKKYEIDPIFGLENMVWAPNRITGQHDYAALKNVVDQLKMVEKFGGSHESIRDNIIDTLRDLGELAAKRRSRP